MNKKDLAVFVATKFEDIELITTLDMFSRQELTYELFSVENLTTVKGKYNAIVETQPISAFKPEEFGGLFLPGGPGVEELLKSEELKKIIKDYHAEKKWLTAICAGPEVLFQAGVLDGVKITSYPGFANNGNNHGHEVQIDSHFITGRDFHATMEFASQVIKKIKL